MLVFLNDGRFSFTVQDIDELGLEGKTEEWALNENQFPPMTPKPPISLQPPSSDSTASSIRMPKNANMATVVGYMGDGIKHLEETYISFLHKAHFNMKRRMQELRELPDMAPEVLKIEDLYQQVMKRNEGIESRIVRAKNIQKNLQERFQLMKEVSLLNTSLTDELTQSELGFKNELVDMQRQHRMLAERSMHLRKQFTESWLRDTDGGRGMSVQYPENVSQVHMGKLKEMLEAQNKSIANAMNQMKILERSVNEQIARLN
eukprot:TRINITY_DN539_c0_g1_i1.p1 TRINITY_DN539_c0_g1~~TRINITY_DN539_c0_g1_i1.p1  ORF type:complete len:261 (+),score=26.72 TRINITY_DN539_c0_g1_i1:268-1050(+)